MIDFNLNNLLDILDMDEDINLEVYVGDTLITKYHEYGDYAVEYVSFDYDNKKVIINIY